MGYRHSKDDILDGAIAAAFDEGLSQLTFGRLARRLGISDRVVVYYFPTKDDLISEVLLALGAQLQAALATTFSAPVTDHRQLVRTAWPLLARPDVDPVFALFFEAAGLAAAGREPYHTFVPQLVDGWIAWAADRLRGTPTTTTRGSGSRHRHHRRTAHPPAARRARHRRPRRQTDRCGPIVVDPQDGMKPTRRRYANRECEVPAELPSQWVRAALVTSPGRSGIGRHCTSRASSPRAPAC